MLTVTPDEINGFQATFAEQWSVPAEVTGTIQSVVYSDPHGRYGMRRLDNGSITIPAGATPYRPNVNGSPVGTIAGPYVIAFNGFDFGTPFEYCMKVTSSTGVRYFHRRGVTPLPRNTSSPAGMAEMIRATLRNNPAALITVTVDGQQVTYSRKQALDEMQYWERRAARESGRRPLVAQIGMEF
ncbi:MAG TPA: hypothetical protein VHY37_07175 [Tepidisphaeraceae bacterium]|jgi:hypothetical protein|nr:hypothetical protein [Tepidisphaeraceae bacterium]